ncbi:hypothetical protein R5H30_11965 [Sulfitobacter sp. D35]|uniref:hypothetical protein n=1 Tax=Sulfitobacter sp. D35 TaxID=3083252 RepID=UPI00296F2B7C|nr:hypothetical protein [Sulfitobacter sp. D35]MDW4498702.1 hypothetical protein [Sulfitobacter sp. D35]
MSALVIATAAMAAVCVTPAGGQSPNRDRKEHTVIILADTYFPDTVYAAIGDNLRFVNESAEAHVVSAVAPAWTTGIIAPGTEIVIGIASWMEGAFYGNGDRAFRGEISFERSPLAD